MTCIKDDHGIPQSKATLTAYIFSPLEFLYNGFGVEAGKNDWDQHFSSPPPPRNKKQIVMELMTNNLINLPPLTACASRAARPETYATNST
jgi:hypothetical protein